MVLQEMERQYANIHLVTLVEKHGTKQVSYNVFFRGNSRFEQVGIHTM